MPIQHRALFRSCFTNWASAALWMASRRSSRASCKRLRSGGVRGTASLAALFLGCSGEAGELFPVLPAGDAPEGGSGGAPVAVAGAASLGNGSAGAQPEAPSGGSSLGVSGGASLGTSGAGGSAPGAGGGTSAGSSGGGATTGNSGGMAAGGAPSDPSPSCDPCPCDGGPFGEPALVLGLGAAVDSFGPAPSADGLTLFFSQVGELGDEDIFLATRQRRIGSFGEVTPVAAVNRSDSAEGTPFASADGSSLFFFSDRAGDGAQGDRDLWLARATEPGAGFSAPAIVPDVNGAELEHLPRLSSDGLRLMFVSGRDSTSASSNIWISEREDGESPFGVPVELPGVNSDARDEGFWLSADGLTIYFASNRVPEADMDIWVARRPSLAAAFADVENLDVVNTPGIEIDPAITADGFELFFASDRGGSMQIYRSARVCP